MASFYCLLIITFKLYILLCLTALVACQKNVLLIIVDDLRPAIRSFGDKFAHTPNIDDIVSSGFSFHRAYAQQALCGPSRTSFLTSRRPDTLRLYDVHRYWRTFAGNFTTIPQYFKENGYDTMSIGKVFHPGMTSNFTDDYPLSWTRPAWHPPAERYKNYPVCQSKDGWFANLVCPVTVDSQPGGTLPDIQSLAKAVQFIDSRQNEVTPFFLAVGFHKPHIPLKFPKQFLEYYPLDSVLLPAVKDFPPSLPIVAWNPWNDIRLRHDISQINVTFPFQKLPDEWIKLIRQSYYASVTYVDDLIGHLYRHLRASTLEENTVVALLGDHGWSLGEHGEWGKYSNFEAALRTPLVFKFPAGLVHARKKTSYEPVELVDIFPTLAELAGLDPVPSCPEDATSSVLCSEGRSLLPIMRKDSGCEKPAFSQYPRPGVTPSITPDSDQPRLDQITIMGYSVRTYRHRYTAWVSWNHTTFAPDWTKVKSRELYDHLIDAEENLNLWGRPELEELEGRLHQLLRRAFPS